MNLSLLARRSAIAFPLLLCLLSFLPITFVQAQAPAITIHKGLPAEPTKRLLYGNGIYLAAVLYPVRFYTSPDTASWSPVTSPDFGRSDSVQPALAYGAGLFVCVADSGKIFTSPDGTTWTRRISPGKAHLLDVQFLQGAFYAVGDSATVFHSADGIDWDRLTTGIGTPTDSYSAIINGNSYYVITATDPTIGKVLYRSGAGSFSSWTADTLATLQSVKFLKDHFYAFGDNVQISTDAAGWSDISHLNPSMVYTIVGGFYDGSQIYLLTNIDVNNGAYGNGYASTDGLTFNSVFQTAGRITDGLYVNNIYFIYGPDGVESSPNAVNFYPLGAAYNALATNGHGFVGVGNINKEGFVYTSPDFYTWTAGTFPTATGLYSVVYDGSRYVTAGNDGYNPFVFVSPDGFTWNYAGPQIIRGETTPSITTVTYGGGVYVGSDPNGLSVSGDAVYWTPVSGFYPLNGESLKVNRVKYVNGYFFGMGDTAINGTLTPWMVVSADGSTWRGITPRLPFTVEAFNDIVYDGSNYYLVGMEGNANTGNPAGFFSVSTADINNPDSYGVKGTVTAPPAGAALRGSSFAYSGGYFVGGALDTNTPGSGYLLYSTDGLHWDNTPLGVIGGNFTGIVPSVDTFRLLTRSNVQVTARFSGIPLPVTLLDLDATVIDATTLLTWQTATEENSRRFTVQRSTDDVHWDSIGVVAAAGQSNTVKNYRYVDESPQKGYDYYRLLLIDEDGRAQISPVKRVSIGDDHALRLYPNPAAGSITLELPESGSGSAVLYDAAGAPVYRQEFNGYAITLSLQGLSAGIYHVWVQQNGKQYHQEILHQ